MGNMILLEEREFKDENYTLSVLLILDWKKFSLNFKHVFR